MTNQTTSTDTLSITDVDLTLSGADLTWPFMGGINNSTLTIAGSDDYNISTSFNNGDMYVDKNLEVHGDIIVGEQSLTERLDRIEERLRILRPNSEMEQRWEQLRLLGEQYRALEQKLTEREYIFEQLKK